MFLIWSFLVFVISMLPIIELCGAVSIGVGLGLPAVWTLVIAIIGNMIPVPFIYKFARRFLEWGKDKKYTRKFCRLCLKKGEKAGKKLEKTTGDSLYFALFLFVGIPVPGTGAWTGTLAASLLDLDYKKTIRAVMGGVLLAGAIMLTVSLGIFQVIF